MERLIRLPYTDPPAPSYRSGLEYIGDCKTISWAEARASIEYERAKAAHEAERDGAKDMAR